MQAGKAEYIPDEPHKSLVSSSTVSRNENSDYQKHRSPAALIMMLMLMLILFADMAT